MSNIPTPIGIINHCLEMEMSTKGLIVTFDGNSTGIMLPFSEEIVNLLDRAHVVKVSREWEGSIKEVKALRKELKLSIVNRFDVKEAEPSQEEKLKKMQEYADKLDAERAALSKEMDALQKL